MRIYASVRRLEEESHRAEWPLTCRYLASKVQLQHLTLVIVNDCSSPQSDVEKMQEICRMDKAWVKYLTWISGLTRSHFILHAVHSAILPSKAEMVVQLPYHWLPRF